MPCIDEKTIWSAQLTLTHIAPLTSLFVGCVGSCRRAFRLWERNRLAQLVHMAKQRAGGAPATWPRRGAHLLRPRLPAASAASSRASASPHRTTVLAVLLPAHSTATHRIPSGPSALRTRSKDALGVGPRPEKHDLRVDRADLRRVRRLAVSGGWAIDSPWHRR